MAAPRLLVAKAMEQALTWTPRVIGIVMALFLAIFSLDARSPSALLAHLLPSAVVAAVVVMAWWRPWIGGAVFLALGATWLVTAWGRFPWNTYAVMAGPLFVAGALYLVQAFAVLRSAR
jgi:hypothetical protein